MLTFASICPHPPIIIPTIGRPSDLKLVSKTIEALEDLAQTFKETDPETVIVISPHGPVNFDEFTLTSSPVLAGHFYHFGNFQAEFIFRNDEKLVEVLKQGCEKAKIPLRLIELKELDHGTLVPLFYLTKGKSDIKVVPLAYCGLDLKRHFEFGKLLYEIVKREDKKIAIVASGDLSHRLLPEAPGGFSPKGKEFDEKLVKLLEKKDIKGILNMRPGLVREAGECGYRSILILLGALDNLDWQPEILSYEGPFGVGYLVTNFKF